MLFPTDLMGAAMEVWGQMINAYLDKGGSMFDFDIWFHIPNPNNGHMHAAYRFDKSSTSQQNAEAAKIDRMSDKEQAKRTNVVVGSLYSLDNGEKRFRYDRLTESALYTNVEAQAEIDEYNGKGFSVRVSLRKKKDHSVIVPFEGGKPSWLKDDGKTVFHGQLMLMEVKNFLDKKP